MLPLSCSASKLEAVVAALSILSPNSLWTVSSPISGSYMPKRFDYVDPQGRLKSVMAWVPYSYFKAHSPLRRPFNQKSAAKTNNFNKKNYTAKVTKVTTAGSEVVVNTAERKREKAYYSPQHVCNPQNTLQDQGIFDSGCSRHMTGNKSYLTDYQDIDGGFGAFFGSPKGGKITRKGKIRSKKLDFEDVYFVKELKFNLFSVSQMCDKKNSVLFTETECLVLSPDFKLLDESQVLLKVPRQNNMYSFDLKNVVPLGDLNYPLGKFDGKVDEGFLVGYSINSKAFMVFNTRTKKVEENMYINFLENKLNVAGSGPEWLFDIDSLTKSMNYEPVTAGNQTNGDTGIEIIVNAGSQSIDNKDLNDSRKGDGNLSEMNGQEKEEGALNKENDQNVQDFRAELDNLLVQQKEGYANNTNRVSIVNLSVSAAGQGFDNADDQERIDSNTQDVNTVGPSINTASLVHLGAYDDKDVGAEADLNNLETTMNVSPIPTTRIHKDHPKDQIIGDLNLSTQTRRMINFSEENAMVSYISKQRRTNHKDYQNCLFACFLSQNEPKKVIQALTDPSWIEAMQEELLQFKLQKVWTLVDLPKGKRAIGTKWVYRNKKDERGIVVRNKARLVAQGYTQEEGIDYDEVFAPVARIEAIRLFFAYASFMGLIVYQMDVKSAFLYGNIEEEVYVCQPPGFEDPHLPDKVYKVEKALYGLHQAPRAWYETLSTYLLENRYRKGTIDKTLFINKDKSDILLVQVYVDDIIFGSTKKSLCVEFKQMMHKRFQMSSTGELTFFLGLQVQQKEDGIFISQDKYVADILKKFDFVTMKTASTPMEPNKALVKDEEAEDVDVRLYRSMIGSLMYLTASRSDITFAYPMDSPFDLEAFSDCDYAGASLDRKSTTGGCQFLGKRLISWQCKKQTIVANSTTKAEYVAAANCCGQVLWIQNQMLDYGFNFMNTKIHIDNESTICIVKNLVFHSKTKHIEIRHHFIRDSYEKKLIQVIKIHTDHNVADLLTKAFDVSRKSKRTTEISQSSGPIHLVADETVYKELGDMMENAATTASSLEVEQDSGNINKTQSMATLNEPSPSKTSSGNGYSLKDKNEEKTGQKLGTGLEIAWKRRSQRRIHLNGPTRTQCMSTRSNSSNLFSPLRDPESLIRRRNLGEPSSLFDFEEVMSIPHNNMGPPPAGPPPPNNGPPPVVRPNGIAPRSMEELCQPSIDGRG
ncbi:putative ribonuclease H-like domain-containing protein [Tanacetum coccineum]